ncbi:hypothetical protein ACHHYP_00284 [Achlya hypogyna]|uniref:Fluoride ion transporter CrcB n=1 Tax=Achlya hypogyna TaxID=1202772 RepID=A0A1V9ZUR3_ACHHY|nr:hypothetical protein ACHHYP_00284 [Achlya hypogyna]
MTLTEHVLLVDVGADHPLRSTKAMSVAWTVFWAYIGVAARVGLTEASTAIEATQAAPSILTAMGVSFFLPNVFGCFIMGLAQPLKTQRLEAFWTGLTTGFCGCCTTFASWELVLSQQYLGHMAVNATFMFFVQLTTSMAAFLGGRHLALLYNGTSAFEARRRDVQAHAAAMATLEDADGKWRALAQALEAVAPAAADACSEPVGAATPFGLAAAATAVSIALAAVYSGSYLAVAFGPPGALLRYGLGLLLNRSKTFPVGTFAANVLASVIDAVAVLAMPASASGAVWVEKALMTGFCGSLSTVSSWINEIHSMPTSSVGYIAGTHIATQTAVLLLLGT